jgi:hypothetical protein
MQFKRAIFIILIVLIVTVVPLGSSVLATDHDVVCATC